MSKYFNPRLLNAVIAGTGMRNPVRPHVILGSEDGEFVRGDLMDANAIQEFINQKISDLVNNAPEALDTLKELADALANDSNFATTIINRINAIDTTYRDIPASWDVDHSMSQLIASINNDTTAVPGKSYLGTVHLSDLPENMMQAELIIEVMDQLGSDGNKVIKFELSSSNVAPYKWEYTSAYGALGEWRSWVVEQQQADWNQTDTNAVDYIKNKPNVALKSDIYTIVGDANGHDYVEIGGIKWATMNVGANSVTDTGLYFQWGDIQGYTAAQCGSGSGQKYFGGADYKYGDGTSSPGSSGMTKYNNTDGKTVLDAEDDAVTATWGGNWRMPTAAEFQALDAAVNTEWVSDYQGSGIAGLVCTDKTDSSKVLFFPACGICSNGSARNVGNYGGYWSSSLYSNSVQRARYLDFVSNRVVWQTDNLRYIGCIVRGVLDGPVPKFATPSDIPAQVQSDWDQSDSTAIDYIKNKPTIPSLSGYATESWVGQQGYLTSHQDISGKEDKFEIVNVSSGTSAITAEIGKCYNISGAETLSITLPTPTGNHVQNVMFFIQTGSVPQITFTSTGNTIYTYVGFSIDPVSKYEINALWNGSAWIIAEIEVSSNCYKL